MAKARLAFLVQPKTVHGVSGDAVVELREYDIPTPGEGEILVKVEGCGICGTDVHEYRYDPFGMAPVNLGHEGTGEVVAIGPGVTNDSKGDPIHVGDKVVTSILLCNDCDYCRRYPELPNLCENLGVYGLIPDDDKHFTGWFSDYILVRKNASIFVVNGKTLDERILIEPACVAVHALNRARTTNLINYGATVLVQGCGPIGLMQTAVLKAGGAVNIICIDGVETRLDMAKEMGATRVINFNTLTTIEERVAQVRKWTHGFGVDFVFQCTGVPQAAADAYKYVRRGGGYCEMGFFVNAGECTINPHFDLCNKEITLVGSWVYRANEYIDTLGFLQKAKEMHIPIEKMVTHHYKLEAYVEAMEKSLSLTGVKIAICP